MDVTDLTDLTDLDRLVAAVRASSKYRAVNADLIRRIGARELSGRGNLKEALKAVKNKLHQVAGAYLDHAPRYERWLQELLAASDADSLRRVCTRLMSRHASTQERLPILDAFYRAIFAAVPAPRRVADLACGLNPLAIPWMGLPASTQYYAADIYDDMMGFTQAFFSVVGVNGVAESRDVLAAPPRGHFDVAFVLKALPCLEQVDKQAARRILDAVDAERLVISYPAHSLGGRAKGMPAHYERQFEQLMAGSPCTWQKLVFQTEVVFIVAKNRL